MKNGRSLVDLAKELERQMQTKRDMIVPSPLMSHQTDDQGECTMVIEDTAGPEKYGITSLARKQLAEKLQIPLPYFERMRTEKPNLLDSNVNSWLRTDPEKRMVRVLDRNVRAILSDSYRRLDNFDLAEHVLPILQNLPGARFESVELTASKMYLKVVTPMVTGEVEKGDVVQAGVIVTNSEVGQGRLTVQPLIYRLVCSNGLILPDSFLKKTHVGKTMHSDDDKITLFQEDTLAAEDKAFFLKVRDVVQAAISEATFAQVVRKMQRTKGIKIVGDPVKSVEVLANRYTLNESERSGVLRNLIEGNDISAYGLVNAVTQYSQYVGDYDRATEFEAIGGKMVEMQDKDWRTIVEAE